MPGQERYQVMIGGARLVFGRHVVERYQERVKPALDVLQIRAELARVLPLCVYERNAPSWAARRDDADGWLVLGDAVAFPVRSGVIVSCLTRGEVGAEIRVVRQHERKERAARARQPGKRKKHGKVAREARQRRQQVREGRAFE